MRFVFSALLLLFVVPPAHGAPAPGPDPTVDPVLAAAGKGTRPTLDAPPDINGPGACVSTAGNVWIKSTHRG